MKIWKKSCFVAAVWLFTFIPLKAAHLRGVDITYECLNACTTRVHIDRYDNCTGNGGPLPTVNWMNSGCPQPVLLSPATINAGPEFTPICPSTQSQCTNSNAVIIGINVIRYSYDYDICTGTPCIYTLVYSECCRNPSINGLVNPGSAGLYSSATTVNTFLPTCNNSPRFASYPTMMVCAGEDHDLSVMGYDEDGDSLSYILSGCLDMGGAPVTYSGGFTFNQPMGPSWNISMNPQTGMIHLDAQPGNIVYSVLCVAVREFRNGALINTYWRDFEVVVAACPGADPNPVQQPLTNATGGAIISGNDVYVTSMTPFCFDVPVTDGSTGQTIQLWWDHEPPGASFTSASNSLIVDTISGTNTNPPVGRFCWTAPASGTYIVRFHAEDENCPLIGITDRVVTIHVQPCVISSAQAVVGACPQVSFSASPCMSGPVTYSWSGSGGLSGSTNALSHNYPGPGSYPWEVIISNGTVSDTLRDTVLIPGTPVPTTIFSGLHYVAPCSGNLYDTLNAGPWSSYQWSTGATTPEIVVFLAGNYHVTVTDASGCPYTDSEAVLWSSPDIYGVVTTSANAPLQNQKIMLVEHDTLAQALWAADSTWTDSLGYYFFCNVTDTLVFLKATPSAFDYPNEMPTYADTTLFWNNAITFYPLTQIPFQHDFSTLPGLNPGGPGFIGGLISQGANKTGAVGDPMPGVRVFLREQGTGNILGHRVTDANGYFSFAGVPLGDYEIVPDRPLVSTLNVPQLSLTTTQPVMDSLDFQMHRYWLELVLHSTVVDPLVSGISISIRPNPFQGSTQLDMGLPEDLEVSWEAFSISGHRVAYMAPTLFLQGSHRFEIGSGLAAGIYLVRFRAGGLERVLKVVKSGE